MSGNETRTQNAFASVPICIVSYSYTVIVPCTVLHDVPINVAYKTQNTFQVLYTSIVICTTGPYYTNRQQGWSKLHTAFTELTSKFRYLSQSAKI